MSEPPISGLEIRPEAGDGSDAPAIDRIHRAAFPTDLEARIVDRLRRSGNGRTSLVAILNSEVAGHVLFSPVEIAGSFPVRGGLGLAPVAVLPALQRKGIGTALVNEGIATCRRSAVPFVIVLGEPAYYSRFGFKRASARKLMNEYGAGAEFMVLELVPGKLPASGGMVRYGQEFKTRSD